MRDDRYRGTKLPKAFRKLFQMSEREADRGHPERLRSQAVKGFENRLNDDVSSTFRQRLKDRESTARLFDGSELLKIARSRLEVGIAQQICDDPAVSSIEAIRRVFDAMGEVLLNYQKQIFLMDRYSFATTASWVAKTACQEASRVASASFLGHSAAPPFKNCIPLNDDLLPQSDRGTHP